MEQTSSDFLKNKSALIVEDEPAIAQLFRIQLSKLGFIVDVCQNSEDALELIKLKKYDFCILDWMLPGMQGVELLKKIKAGFPAIRVMMVTAKADADSIVFGLDAGADDYLTKPFDSQVLVARIRNIMRRSQNAEIDKVDFDGLSINYSKYEVKLNDEIINLTPSEFKLLSALLKANSVVLTRDNLIEQVQGQDIAVTGRTIDTHIFSLRKKIGPWSEHIETIRGVGYRILISNDDVTEGPL